jgi:hypothetical protein
VKITVTAVLHAHVSQTPIWVKYGLEHFDDVGVWPCRIKHEGFSGGFPITANRFHDAALSGSCRACKTDSAFGGVSDASDDEVISLCGRERPRSFLLIMLALGLVTPWFSFGLWLVLWLTQQLCLLVLYLLLMYLFLKCLLLLLVVPIVVRLLALWLTMWLVLLKDLLLLYLNLSIN